MIPFVIPKQIPCKSHFLPVNGTDLKRTYNGPETEVRGKYLFVIPVFRMIFLESFARGGVHFCRFYGYNILEIKPKRKRAPPSL